MPFRWITTVVLALALTQNLQAAGSDDRRVFLFVGEPSTAAWRFLMENPADRELAVKAAMEKVGGRILSYYFGLGDGRNYIVVDLPNDNEVIQAIYLMRMPTGLLKSYEVTELMTSSQMSRALVKSSEFIEMESQMVESPD